MYNSWDFLGFIGAEGGGYTNQGDTYLSHLPDTYSNVYFKLFFVLVYLEYISIPKMR